MNLSLTRYLPEPVRSAFQDLIDAINAGWTTEHNEDGTHLKVTSVGNVIAGGYGTFVQPRALVYGSGTLTSIADSTETILSWTQPKIPDAPNVSSTGVRLGHLIGGFTLGGADKSLIVPVDGLYYVASSIRWAANGTGIRELMLQWDLEDFRRYNATPTAADITVNHGSAIIPCKKGDFLSVQAFQSSGGPLNTDGDTRCQWFQAVKIA